MRKSRSSLPSRANTSPYLNTIWDNVLYHAKGNFLPILCSKFYKEKSHPFEELIRVTSEGGEGFLGNLAEELLRVHLDTIVTTTLAPGSPSPITWWMEKVGESMLASLLTLSQASSPYFCCSLMFYINPNVLSRTLCLYLDVPREVFEDETVHGGPKLVSEERPR